MEIKFAKDKFEHAMHPESRHQNIKILEKNSTRVNPFTAINIFFFNKNKSYRMFWNAKTLSTFSIKTSSLDFLSTNILVSTLCTLFDTLFDNI